MVIEWLRFRVAPGAREKFIEKDAEIWTEFLSRQDGHLGKEVWIDPSVDDEVIVVAHWQTLERWQAIGQDLLDETEARFQAAMGAGTYELVESRDYQVRKFSDR